MKSVLLVDDNVAMRRMLRNLFVSEPDFEIVGEAENGREALEKARELKPDLVILDLAMPVMNGLDAAFALRQMLPETRIILFTLYDGGFEQAARRAGIDAVVSKTQAIPDLLNTARQMLGA
jgi:YesN/AraC family two-component response regulator